MRRRVIGAPIEIAQCKRCCKTFRYAHKTKPRIYCAPCIPKRRQEWNDESNRFQREQRLKARETARLCHARS